MDDQAFRELQDLETWEHDGDVRPPVRPSRAIVSVGFTREDLAIISDAARQGGMKTSEYIRAAAITAAAEPRTIARLVSIEGLASNDHPVNRTRGPLVTGALGRDVVSG